eukprot:366537-Chlamydomonas_euryale.AAC.13
MALHGPHAHRDEAAAAAAAGRGRRSGVGTSALVLQRSAALAAAIGPGMRSTEGGGLRRSTPPVVWSSALSCVEQWSNPLLARTPRPHPA